MEVENAAELYSKANDLIEDIYRFKKEYAEDLSLIETIIEYSFKTGIPLQELGNILSDHKDFVNIFRKQLTKEKYFRDGVEEEYENEEW
jgi:ribosome-interacting GTPase 1